MIIRNGFVRDDTGRWYSLDLFDNFDVKVYYQAGVPSPASYFIVGFWKDGDEGDPYIELSEEFDDFHQAHCALDDAFGITGE
jgi:hypothetical protein